MYVIIRFGLITFNFIDSIPLLRIAYTTVVVIFYKVKFMKENLLMKYAEQLATEIELLCQSLSNIKDCSNTVFQIRKASSSVFANVTEAQYPQSLPDMLSKLKIARKECFETESWLKLLFSTGHISEEIFKEKRNLCGRIRRILTASCITIEKKIQIQ